MGSVTARPHATATAKGRPWAIGTPPTGGMGFHGSRALIFQLETPRHPGVVPERRARGGERLLGPRAGPALAELLQQLEVVGLVARCEQGPAA